MLIFDEFKTREAAENFVRFASAEFGLSGQVCDSQAESNGIDPFPFELCPPIALVERCDKYRDEAEVSEAVEKFGGHFAGT